MRIAFVDSYYPEFLKTLTVGNGSYQEELDKVLARQFGTADFFSREFRKLGWEAIDIIANYSELQALWKREAKVHPNTNAVQTAVKQIERFKPDVVFLQDLSFFDVTTLHLINAQYHLAAQVSCALPNHEKVRPINTIFTSFPHYVSKLTDLGVNAVYMPLAFHESVLKPPVERDIDVSFVGGIGWQWKRGLEVLEAVAREIPTFKWWGYGVDQLGQLSHWGLRTAYQGTAWGDEMYSIYQRSKIVINRHGEIAENYANNMRMYEATGCGALLVTERKDNMAELFGARTILYSTANEAVQRIRESLAAWDFVSSKIARDGQACTLSRHTYAHRVPKIAEVVTNAMATV